MRFTSGEGTPAGHELTWMNAEPLHGEKLPKLLSDRTPRCGKQQNSNDDQRRHRGPDGPEPPGYTAVSRLDARVKALECGAGIDLPFGWGIQIRNLRGDPSADIFFVSVAHNDSNTPFGMQYQREREAFLSNPV